MTQAASPATALTRSHGSTDAATSSRCPSAVSAIKVDGERAYKRVRAGEDVELPARPVTVTRVRRPGVYVARMPSSTSTCTWSAPPAPTSGHSRATSERTLGVGGHLTALRRTRVGAYDLAESRTLEQLAEEMQVIPLDAAARRQLRDVRVGQVPSDGGSQRSTSDRAARERRTGSVDDSRRRVRRVATSSTVRSRRRSRSSPRPEQSRCPEFRPTSTERVIADADRAGCVSLPPRTSPGCDPDQVSICSRVRAAIRGC